MPALFGYGRSARKPDTVALQIPDPKLLFLEETFPPRCCLGPPPPSCRVGLVKDAGLSQAGVLEEFQLG